MTQDARLSSLADWPVGSPARVLDLGADPAIAQRLAQLGLRRGATLVPAQRTPGRGLVVHSGELRLALDRASAVAVRVGPLRRPVAPAAGVEGGR
ncbi:MAG TPA: ferrous iron transport protein A [Dermatophilaceae bacterium]|nr:ferrous iron transport protein A [Dermatophilaceae bacterium]